MYFTKKRLCYKKGGEGEKVERQKRKTERKSQTESVREIVKEGERLRE